MRIKLSPGLSHSLVSECVNHELPTTKQFSQVKKRLIIQGFSKDICQLLLGGNIFDVNIPFLIVAGFDPASKVMIFNSNVLCPKSKFLRVSHCNSGLVILMHCETKVSVRSV